MLFGHNPFAHRNFPRVLLVEDDDARAAWMVHNLPGVMWDRAHTTKLAQKKIVDSMSGRGNPYAAVFLDYDLNAVRGGGGERMAALLAQLGYTGKIVVHSANPVGGPRMAYDLQQCGYDVIYAPITDSRSLNIWRAVLASLPR